MKKTRWLILLFCGLLVMLPGCKKEKDKQTVQTQRIKSQNEKRTNKDLKPIGQSLNGQPSKPDKPVQGNLLMNDQLAPSGLSKKYCGSCHGEGLAGGTAPAIDHVGQKMTEIDILHNIVDGHAAMQKIAMSEGEAGQVARWLSQKK